MTGIGETKENVTFIQTDTQNITKNVDDQNDKFEATLIINNIDKLDNKESIDPDTSLNETQLSDPVNLTSHEINDIDKVDNDENDEPKMSFNDSKISDPITQTSNKMNDIDKVYINENDEAELSCKDSQISNTIDQSSNEMKDSKDGKISNISNIIDNKSVVPEETKLTNREDSSQSYEKEISENFVEKYLNENKAKEKEAFLDLIQHNKDLENKLRQAEEKLVALEISQDALRKELEVFKIEVNGIENDSDSNKSRENHEPDVISNCEDENVHFLKCRIHRLTKDFADKDAEISKFRKDFSNYQKIHQNSDNDSKSDTPISDSFNEITVEEQRNVTSEKSSVCSIL